MAIAPLRFRQIHLDFHTSEHIAGIGDDFDPKLFADTLSQARVDSITCFARCHHGYIYYDTKAHPERHHPHLKRNLLVEQIRACHARNIRVPVYTTVQWDHYTACQEPGWLKITPEGAILGTKPFEAGFYRTLCFNSPYVDFLKAHVADIFECVGDVDGLFFDIMGASECCCPRCIAKMDRLGLDASKPDDQRKYAVEITNAFKLDMSEHVRRFKKDCTIFYNDSHVGPRHRAVVTAHSHLELESLPSGGWGYWHYPMAVRYARTLGLDHLGMTGKFHTSWGDFGSFKNQAALEFECFRMLAMGGKCSIGDQLHPSGKICPATYDLVGSVYREVEKKEPWCDAAEPVVEVGLMSPEESCFSRWWYSSPSLLGALRMLQELRVQFDILDSKSDFGRYRLLVLPDEIAVDETLAAKLHNYVKEGGKIIASHKAGLRPDGQGFAGDFWPIRYKGDAPFSPDFIQPRPALAAGMNAAQHVMYKQAVEVEPVDGAEVLADVYVPYFNRTWRHFCSHRHTPSANRIGYAGVVRKGGVAYFAHPVFSQFHQNSPRWCKQLFSNVLDLLIGPLMVRIDGPSTVVATLNAQPSQQRQVLHLLHYIPERRGQDFDIIEDVIPLYDLKCSVASGKPVKSVTAVPQGQKLDFAQKHGRVEFVLPELLGHQMVELQLG